MLTGSSRAVSFISAAFMLGLTGCPATDDSRTDTDTDASTDTAADDTGSGLPAVESSEVTLEIDVQALPTSAAVRLVCDERILVGEDQFIAFGTRSWVFPVNPGESCRVELENPRGGVLPGGRLFNCSDEAAAWEADRGRESVPASIELTACVSGCVDELAENYDPAANRDDGSCVFIEGCTDPEALNFDAGATRNDGTCDYGGFGSLEVFIHTDDRPTETTVRILCEGRTALVIDDLLRTWTTERVVTSIDAGFTCVVRVEDAQGDAGPGGRVEVCGEPLAAWDPLTGEGRAWEREVGTFSTRPCSGCTDPSSPDFDPDAVADDGSCTYP